MSEKRQVNPSTKGEPSENLFALWQETNEIEREIVRRQAASLRSFADVKTFIENTDKMLLFFEYKDNFFIRFVSGQICDFFQLTEEQLIGKSVDQYLMLVTNYFMIDRLKSQVIQVHKELIKTLRLAGKPILLPDVKIAAPLGEYYAQVVSTRDYVVSEQGRFLGNLTSIWINPISKATFERLSKEGLNIQPSLEEMLSLQKKFINKDIQD